MGITFVATSTTRSRMTFVTQRKAFEIPKSLVWASYHDVRRNRGAPGCDGQTLAEFDQQRDRNLYKIWNRLCSGSRIPVPGSR